MVYHVGQRYRGLGHVEHVGRAFAWLASSQTSAGVVVRAGVRALHGPRVGGGAGDYAWLARRALDDASQPRAQRWNARALRAGRTTLGALATRLRGNARQRRARRRGREHQLGGNGSGPRGINDHGRAIAGPRRGARFLRGIACESRSRFGEAPGRSAVARARHARAHRSRRV